MNVQEMGRMMFKLKTALPKWSPEKIDRDLAELWLEALKDFPDQAIGKAFLTASTNLTEWPPLATIKRLCQGSVLSDEEIGTDVSSRIESAIGKFGYTLSEQAEEFIGELGWEVVKQSGGWNWICETTSSQLPAARKQWRELATTISKKIHMTGSNSAPKLPEGVTRLQVGEGRQAVRDVICKLTGSM